MFLESFVNNKENKTIFECCFLLHKTHQLEVEHKLKFEKKNNKAFWSQCERVYVPFMYEVISQRKKKNVITICSLLKIYQSKNSFS